jgi:NTE family protein
MYHSPSPRPAAACGALLCLALCGLGGGAAAAAAGDEAQSVAFRATPAERNDGQGGLALVLGGGGALGLAHVGVLLELERLGISPDIVVGTSMGAVIGSLYAAGYSPAEIGEIARTTPWETLFSDESRRRRLVFRRKEEERLFQTDLRIGVGRNGLRLPRGLIAGRRLEERIATLLSQRTLVTDFDRLPRRFRAVATDIETFDPVVLGSGSLTKAVFASMAVPGLLPPQEVDGLTLLDGGLAANVPVDVARDMGAERIIAVNLTMQPLEAESVENIVDVVGQIAIYLTLINTRNQLRDLTEGDVLIEPAFGELGPMDFGEAEALIRIGRDAAAANVAALRALRPAPAAPRAVEASPPEAGRRVVTAVTITNETDYPTRFVREALAHHTGVPLDYVALSEDIDALYGTEEFSTITYRLEPDGAGRAILAVTLEPRAIGNNYLRAGIRSSTDFRNESTFDFVAGMIARNVTPSAGEIRGGVEIGDDLGLFGEFFQPWDARHTWFLSTSAAARRQRLLATDMSAEAFGEVRLDQLEIALAGGHTFGRTAQLRLGVAQEWGELNNVAGLADALPISYDALNAFARLSVDTADDQFFPTRGTFGNLLYRRRIGDRESAAFGISRVEGRLSRAFSLPAGAGVLVPTVEFGFTLEDDMLEFPGPGGEPTEFAGVQTLGGPSRLSGITQDTLRGRHKLLGVLTWYRELGSAPMAGLYTGLTLEAGDVFRVTDDIALSELRFGGSVFLGANTPVGQIRFGAGITGDRTAVFLLVGSEVRPGAVIR